MEITKELIDKIKISLRISHDALDGDIEDSIGACFADLAVCGVKVTDENDPLILSAVKLYCKAAYTDDQNKAGAYMARYDALKACLMMAKNYGWTDDDEGAGA